MEKVDVESPNKVNDRDKLFLVCTEYINSNVGKEVCYSFKTYLPFFSDTFSGASEREVRQRSTLGKKNW